MPDFHQKSFRIQPDDDRFFSKLLSKETSKSTPSFRVYYGDVSSAVPFTWETRPGTPKHHASSENSRIPPLTPPPSYYTNQFDDSAKKNSRSKLLLHNLLRKVNPRKSQSAMAPSSRSSSSSLSSQSWSSSTNSSFSDPISTPANVRKRRRFSSWGSASSFDEKASIEERRRGCFGGEKLLRGGYSAVVVKRALLSIVGRGSAA